MFTKTANASKVRKMFLKVILMFVRKKVNTPAAAIDFEPLGLNHSSCQSIWSFKSWKYTQASLNAG